MASSTLPFTLALTLLLPVPLFSVQGAGAESEARENPARESSMRILALGDSYTIGEAVDESERWPVQLAELLRERGHDVAEPEIVAATGWTTDELMAGIEAAELTPPYDLVTLLIGVNNQYRGRPLDEYREQFQALVERALTLAGMEPLRLLVLSIPDYGVTPFAADRDPERIGREIDRFNEAAREISGSYWVRWIDVTPISREAREDPSLLAPDGLHPSGKMYARWARLALSDAELALGTPGSDPGGSLLQSP